MIAGEEKTEKDIDGIAKIVGGIAVVLVVLLMFVAPELANPIWIALTVLGILFGLFTFLRPAHSRKKTISLTQKDAAKIQPYIKEIVDRLNAGEPLGQVAQQIAPQAGVTNEQVVAVILLLMESSKQQGKGK